MQAKDTPLKAVFGFDSFRPNQEAVISAICAGQNTLAIMPTGGGKSLCYQLPALMRDGITLVISPLIALMRDQVRALQAAGVSAGALTSANTEAETDQVMAALHDGSLRLLYLAPERLSRAGTLRMLRQFRPAMIAVDEAHCVSQWGHDFRPDYLRIGELRATLGDVQITAFTATADAETRAEIIRQIFPGQPEVFLGGFDRPNIQLGFQSKDQPRQQVLRFVSARKDQAGIIYCASRAKTESLARALRETGVNALAYHAGLDPADRRDVEARFQTEDGLVICATIAFGMGVDKPDIRYVLHADLPKSIESYYQEIGRAGRDGAPAEALTLYGAEDIRLRRAQIDEGLAPQDRKAADHARLGQLLALAEAPMCRRQSLLSYFGETQTAACGNCDLCLTPPKRFDATEPARMALSAVLRTGEFFGIGHLTDLLRGQSNDKILERGHDQLPTFGVGRAFDKRAWQMIFLQLAALDYLRPDHERYGALRVTEAARPLLRGEITLELREDSLRRATTPGQRAARALVPEEDEPLFSALKAKRRALAEAANVPAYVVFNDRTLAEMAMQKPQSLDDMITLPGVGAKKLERYGAAFLAVITGASDAPLHPERRKLAASGDGELFDRLEERQGALYQGICGTLKPLSCSRAVLKKIAMQRPQTDAALARIPGIDPARLERFSEAFLEEILRE